MGNKIISRFSKNAQEEVIIQLTNFKGYKLIDIRVWLKSLPTENGESKATKKGISLKTEAIPKLIEALKNAEENLNSRT